MAHLDPVLGVQGNHRRARLAHLLGHDGRLRPRDRGGRAAGLRDRQLAPRLCRHVPADDRLQRLAQGGLRSDPGGVVRHRRRPGDPDRVPDQLLPDHGQHRDRTRHPRAGARRRAAGAGCQALGRAGQDRPAALHALLLCFAQGRDHAGLRRYHRVRDDGCQRGHRLPVDLGRLGDADGAGLRRTGGGRCDGDADVRALQRDREAHHRLGASRWPIAKARHEPERHPAGHGPPARRRGRAKGHGDGPPPVRRAAAGPGPRDRAGRAGQHRHREPCRGHPCTACGRQLPRQLPGALHAGHHLRALRDVRRHHLLGPHRPGGVWRRRIGAPRAHRQSSREPDLVPALPRGFRARPEADRGDRPGGGSGRRNARDAPRFLGATRPARISLEQPDRRP
ncbi:hypothetical protein VARIO8X_60198 [Burkholderiales bacterium 8X]|nr:hypothetical protein VARIO8X_60198 [Burkholderiales bacterium 8X]